MGLYYSYLMASTTEVRAAAFGLLWKTALLPHTKRGKWRHGVAFPATPSSSRSGQYLVRSRRFGVRVDVWFHLFHSVFAIISRGSTLGSPPDHGLLVLQPAVLHNEG